MKPFVRVFFGSLLALGLGGRAQAEVRSQRSGDRDVITVTRVAANLFQFNYCAFEKPCHQLGDGAYTFQQIQKIHAHESRAGFYKLGIDGALVAVTTIAAGAVGVVCVASAGTVCAAIAGSGSMFSGAAAGIGIVGGSASIGALSAIVGTSMTQLNPQSNFDLSKATSESELQNQDVRISASILKTAQTLDRELRKFDVKSSTQLQRGFQ